MNITASLDTGYPALILKASRRTIHHGALDVARSLGKLGVPVYAIVEDCCTPLATSRYLTKAFVWNSWPTDRKAFLTAMSTVGEVINRPTVLFPMDDLSAIFVAENIVDLSRWYRAPPLSWSPRQLANKADFYTLCAKIGVPIARTAVARSFDDIRAFSEVTTFPVVLKAAEQWRLLNNVINVKIIRSREALLKFSQHISFADTTQIILQEFIPGDDWIYHGYCNADNNLYVSFTGKKLLDYPPGAGSTALGLSFPNETLRSQIEAFLRAISYSGIIDVDARLDQRDGKYKIMDCNPRVGMNFRMFENNAGIDVVRAQHLNLTGRSVANPPMIEKKLFVVESYYLLSLLRGGRNARAINAGICTYRKNREFAWWNADDILPFVVMAFRLFVQTIRRACRYFWSTAYDRLKR